MSKGIWGSFSTFMVFAVLIVPGAYLAGSHADAVEQNFDYHTSDTVLLSRTSMYGDYMNNSYIPRSFNLSVDSSIYRLGSQGGELDWSRENVPQNDLTDRLKTSLEHRIENDLTEYIDKADKSIGCDVSASYSVSLDNDDSVKTANSKNSNVRCLADNVETSFGLSETFRMAFEDKTFFQLANTVDSAAESIKDESPDEKITKTASETSPCRTSEQDIDEESIETDAKEQARQNAINAFKNDLSLNKGLNSYDSEKIESEFSYGRFNPAYSLASLEETTYGECQYYAGCIGEGVPSDLSPGACTLHENGTQDYNEGVDYYAEAEYTLHEVVFDVESENPISSTSDMDRLLTSKGVRQPLFSIEYNHGLE